MWKRHTRSQGHEHMHVQNKMPYQNQAQEWDNDPISVSEKKIQEHIAKHEVYRTASKKSTHVVERFACGR